MLCLFCKMYMSCSQCMYKLMQLKHCYKHD